jgi:hypothetical protein
MGIFPTNVDKKKKKGEAQKVKFVWALFARRFRLGL